LHRDRAGQWGSALSLACKMFKMECKVYMVKVSYEQKPYRRSMIHTWGAEVVASPSTEHKSGQGCTCKESKFNRQPGLAISEAVEDAAGRQIPIMHLASVLNHVLLHQTIIGLESQKQMEKAGVYPESSSVVWAADRISAALHYHLSKDKLAGKNFEPLQLNRQPAHR